AEHFALLQHEAARRGAVAAADEKLDAARLEHEEILRGIARPIKHRPRLVALAPRQGSELFQNGLLKSIEKLPRAQPADVAAEVKRVAFDRDGVALQRRLRDAKRRAGAHIPLPKMHRSEERRVGKE